MEIMAYLSLLAFFQAYSRYERIAVGVIGTVYIILANAIRITVIGVIIYYKGMSAYYMAHTFVGRIVFMMVKFDFLKGIPINWLLRLLCCVVLRAFLFPVCIARTIFH